MIYFGIDVLVNYLVEQDKDKNAEAVGLYNHATEKGDFFAHCCVCKKLLSYCQG